MNKYETKQYSIKFQNADYAYFENNKLGDDDAGGLWFKNRVLIDYDGVYELDNEIIETLKSNGYNMDYAIIND